MKKSNILKGLLLPVMVLSFTSCKPEEEEISSITIQHDLERVGTKVLDFSDTTKTEIIFFDSDNSMSVDGKTFARDTFDTSKCINSSESYMLKNGNVEILVDAGHQLAAVPELDGKNDPPFSFTNTRLKNTLYSNRLRKIASVCEDGILDYMVITHADFDHIADCCYDGGLFDAFIKHEEIETYNGKTVKLQQIKNLIDFDSGVVKLMSYYKLLKEARLINSAIYQAYIQKRDQLVAQNKTNYLPAAALFDSGVLTADKKFMTEENKMEAIPYIGDHAEKGHFVTENNGTAKAQEFVKETIKNKQYSEQVKALNGELKKEKGKFYFAVPFNNAELRFLYNWFYDYAETSYKSTDRNNISVLIELVDNNFKYLGLGDLAGQGETGLVKYYKMTSILNDSTVFKASHHGSTRNKENSIDLFDLAKPKIIPVVGCAQNKIDAFAYQSSAAFIQQPFMDNVFDGLNTHKINPLILYTNINHFKNTDSGSIYQSAPFYGDIRISYFDNVATVANSFVGDIEGYVYKDFHIEYENENKKLYSFKTRNDKKIFSFQETDWFEKIGLKYGKEENAE